MAALILDERCFISASLIFFLQIKTEQAISGSSAATFKAMEPAIGYIFFKKGRVCSFYLRMIHSVECVSEGEFDEYVNHVTHS